MVAHVISVERAPANGTSARVLVLDADAPTTTRVIAAVDDRASVTLFADIDEILGDLERRPDGIVVFGSAVSRPLELLMRVRARRSHVPVVVVGESQSASALRALGASAVVACDATEAQLRQALTGPLNFAASV
jgi:DNA-binding NtrC family response regulator